jgi:pimeloyl-ACP methyl ester carboxylesterase
VESKNDSAPRLAARATLAAVAALAALLYAGGAAAAPNTIIVGKLTLTLCKPRYTGYCGSIERPLDPGGAIQGHMTVGFEYYPRSDQAHASLGTILPQEGGPGYSSTGTREFYLALFDALRDRRDVLIVDKRGTGLSDPVDCPALQTGTTALDAVAACAKQLGDTAWYYGTDYAVADIFAVLDALEIETVDFYGDSYGTFVGQVVAGLYPHRLRSIILDSAYPVRPPDPWFATDWAAAWSGIEVVCARSPSCSSLGGTATSRVQSLIDPIRRMPITGTAPDGKGDLEPTSVDTGTLIFTIDSAGFGPPVYRDLDAAARAWLDSGDALPLLRLVAEQYTDYRYSPAAFSYGLYTAVICSDYPLMYDMSAPRDVRDRQYARELENAREHRPDLFAPFTVGEGVRSQVYITPLDSCLPWPAPPQDLSPGAPGAPLPASVQFPAVPTLILSGDLDSITSVIDANNTAAQFPDATHVVVPNLGHVVADGDQIGCTLAIVHRFVRDLSPGNTSCVQQVRPVRTVPVFARFAAELAPLNPLAGDETTDAQRRIAAAGLETVGDAIARYWVTYNYFDRGLRGGSYTYAATDVGYAWDLHDVRWTEDVAVSGTVSWNMSTNIITAQVTLENGGKALGTLDIRWNDADIDAVATVSGEIRGATLNANRIAP